MAYIGLKLKSSHITKYSKSLELILFLIFSLHINKLRDSLSLSLIYYYKDPTTRIYIK